MSARQSYISKKSVAVMVFGLAVGLLAGLNILVSAIPAPAFIVGVVDDEDAR